MSQEITGGEAPKMEVTAQPLTPEEALLTPSAGPADVVAIVDGEPKTLTEVNEMLAPPPAPAYVGMLRNGYRLRDVDRVGVARPELRVDGVLITNDNLNHKLCERMRKERQYYFFVKSFFERHSYPSDHPYFS